MRDAPPIAAPRPGSSPRAAAAAVASECADDRGRARRGSFAIGAISTSRRALLVAAAVLVAACAAPLSARAVLVTQHALPQGATTIFSGPQGLFISDGSSAYQMVTASPFAVTPGAGGQAARSFFVGPDGNTWYIGALLRTEGGQQEVLATLDEITPEGPMTRFTYPSAGSDPTWAVTGPDSSVWAVEPGTSSLDHIAGGGLVPVPLGSGNAGPVQVVSGPGGDLWTANMVNGKIARITPEGEVTEYLVPGGGFGSFGNTEPFGLLVGPDGAVWFAEQNHGSIGRITPEGQISSVSITPPPGASGAPQPRYLTVGPDGAIWFTDPGTNSIGRVAGGSATEYPIPAANAVPDVIVAAGSELFFNERGAHDIGSVNPAAAAAEAVPKAQAPAISRARLSRALAVTGRAGAVAAVLKRGGYTTTIALPAAGAVSITWTGRGHATVATGRRTLAAAGPAEVRLRLTRAGRRLLAKANGSVELSAKATAALSGSGAVTATRSIRLSRQPR